MAKGIEGPAGKKMVTPAVKRQAVAHLLAAHEMSERRACHLVGADRRMIRDRSRRRDDAALRERMRVLAGERRRFGYRRLHVLLRQEGLVMNRKKTERLYREERLTLRRRRGREARRRGRVHRSLWRQGQTPAGRSNWSLRARLRLRARPARQRPSSAHSERDR